MASLTKGQVNSYAFYGFSVSVGIAIPMSYLTIFMTENLYYSAALMGTTLLIARIFDFLIGLISGGVVEKSRFKWGKFRSWILILRFVVFLGCIIQFIDTSALSTIPKMIITIIGYAMLHWSMNFLQIAQFGTLSAMAGTNMEDRAKLSIRTSQFMAAAMIITSAIALPLIQFLTPIVGNNSSYLIASILFGLVYLIGATVLTRASAPYDLPQSKESDINSPTVTVKDMINSVFTNNQLLVYISSSILFYVGMMLVQGIMAYYFMFVLGNLILMSVAMTSTTVFGLVASIIGPKFGLKLGKKNAMVVGLLVYAVGSIAITFFARTSLIVFIVLSCFNALGMYFYMGFGANYVLDIGEYGFYKTGKDNRAVAIGVMNIPMKVGLALGGALGGYGLAFVGYTPGMAPNPDFISKFMWLIGAFPAVFYISAALIMLFGYKITDEDAAKYARVNAERMSKQVVTDEA
ncbi:MFS transporter [Alkalibaculum sp. M08DMB]|uniref:MFS transporter n=1 Tax=Alkalibaculum sporogenes TaxID=2655001 RepID=A0A6A7KB44_9FIRM|nr:MFS transporter [Alkalibaculum sporogenes]MPW26501.1 MFS transporter [Alkalibaculum sporogenes]